MAWPRRMGVRRRAHGAAVLSAEADPADKQARAMTKAFENLPLILYAPPYDPGVGGSLAMHKLCHLLNNLGRRASIYPGFFCREFRRVRSVRQFGGCLLCRWRWLGNNALFYRRHSPATLSAPYSKHIPRRFVAIYPEVVSGNPLGAPIVVRWLLNKPGVLTGEAAFGRTDLLLVYAPHFADSASADVPTLELRCQILKTDTFREPVPAPQRHGSCYILRKGRKRRIVHDLRDSIRVDGMSDQQMAEVFSRVEVCYSYDPYTMLSRYAALCGCLSVVVPQEGVDKQAWRPRAADRYGLAYGLDDAAWARETLPAMKAEMTRIEEHSVEQVERFLAALDDLVACRPDMPDCAAPA